jgi:hypothetical protein
MYPTLPLFLLFLFPMTLVAQGEEIPPRVYLELQVGGTRPGLIDQDRRTSPALALQTQVTGLLELPMCGRVSLISGFGIGLRELKQTTTDNGRDLTASSNATYLEWPLQFRVFINKHQVGLYLPLRSSLGFLLGSNTSAETPNPRDPDNPALFPGRDVHVRETAFTLATGLGYRFDRGPRRHGYFELIYRFSPQPVIEHINDAPLPNYLHTAVLRSVNFVVGLQF